MEERLQKLLAAAGIASRRKAEEMIAEGRVCLNGKVVTEPGTKADFGKDKITVDGKLVERKERKIYVLLNKPKGYVCTVSDTHGRPTVLDLLPDWNVRMYPVGRLDLETSGLLLLTNDGSFTNKVIHPAREIDKVYCAKVQGAPSEEKLNLLRKGLVLEDESFGPAKIRLLAKKGRDTVWEVIIHEGKKRQIRRMFKEIKHPVLELTRTNIDFLSCKGLKEGEWRFLKKEEIRRLLGDIKEPVQKQKIKAAPKVQHRKNKYLFYEKRV